MLKYVGQFWFVFLLDWVELGVYVGKENAMVRRVFLLALTCFGIPNVENARNWVANVVLKFNDDPMENEFEIVVFLRQVWWAAGKRKGFGKRREKNENDGKRRHRQSEN